ncbi:Tf2-9, partial [Mucuna pruriens]
MSKGVDILGPFPLAPGQIKFLIVAVDYFTKWIEAEPVVVISVEKVKKFLWKKIICRFSLPTIIVSDNGTQFASKTTAEFCQGLGIKQVFTSVVHPQTNGQAEATNKVILRGLRRRLEEAKGWWVEELPQVLWSYHTTPHSATNETPLRLAFGTKAVIPVEIGEPPLQTKLFEPKANEGKLRANLDMIQEVREAAHIREFAIKARVAKLYNQKVIPRNFKPQDLVLRRTVHKAESNKLMPKWEGPFRVRKEVGRGAYKLETLKGKEIPRTWNAASLQIGNSWIRLGLVQKWQLNKVDHGLDSDKSYKCHLHGRPWIRLGLVQKWQLNKVDHGLDSDKSYKCYLHSRPWIHLGLVQKWQLKKVDHGLNSDKPYNCHLHGRPWIRLGLVQKWQLNKVDHGLDSDKSYKRHLHDRPWIRLGLVQKWQLNKVDHGLDSDKSYKCYLHGRPWIRLGLVQKWQLNKVDHGLDSDKSYKRHLHGRPWIRLGLVQKWQLNKVDHGLDSAKSYIHQGIRFRNIDEGVKKFDLLKGAFEAHFILIHYIDPLLIDGLIMCFNGILGSFERLIHCLHLILVVLLQVGFLCLESLHFGLERIIAKLQWKADSHEASSPLRPKLKIICDSPLQNFCAGQPKRIFRPPHPQTSSRRCKLGRTHELHTAVEHYRPQPSPNGPHPPQALRMQ